MRVFESYRYGNEIVLSPANFLKNPKLLFRFLFFYFACLDHFQDNCLIEITQTHLRFCMLCKNDLVTVPLKNAFTLNRLNDMSHIVKIIYDNR